MQLNEISDNRSEDYLSERIETQEDLYEKIE